MANGIPALLGQVANVANTVNLVVADALNILGMFAGPKWGVFNQDGSLALKPDSVISVGVRRESKIPDYPQEKGAFQSYNKVQRPSETTVRMTKGGTDDDRANFLIAVSGLQRSLTLVDVNMPDVNMTGCNATRFDFQRTSTSGVGLVIIDITFVAVITAPSAAYANTAQPSGAGQVSSGNVQPQTPTTAQATASSQSQ